MATDGKLGATSLEMGENKTGKKPGGENVSRTAKNRVRGGVALSEISHLSRSAR